MIEIKLEDVVSATKLYNKNRFYLEIMTRSPTTIQYPLPMVKYNYKSTTPTYFFNILITHIKVVVYGTPTYTTK